MNGSVKKKEKRGGKLEGENSQIPRFGKICGKLTLF